VITADKLIEPEWIGRRHGEEIADPRIIIDRKGAIIPVEDLKGPAAPGEVVFPWLAGEQNPDPSVGIDAKDGDVAVGFSLEVHPGLFTPAIRVLVAIGPQADALAFG
jgi:hypothetical protein